MEQTFNDLLRERAEEDKGLFGFALWMFVETSAGVVRENLTFFTMQKFPRTLIVWAAVVALILLVPLVAMRFTEEVNWSLLDFAVMGALLFGIGLAYELVARKAGAFEYRVAVGVALAAAFLLVWVNGAVGIIGDSDVNVMYFGVIAVLVIGAAAARLAPRRMAYALFATALAQALVPVIALSIGTPGFAPGVMGVFTLNAFFVMLFAGSALLFRSAARNQPPGG